MLNTANIPPFADLVLQAHLLGLGLPIQKLDAEGWIVIPLTSIATWEPIQNENNATTVAKEFNDRMNKVMRSELFEIIFSANPVFYRAHDLRYNGLIHDIENDFRFEATLPAALGAKLGNSESISTHFFPNPSFE